jgi:hypothetical protein
MVLAYIPEWADHQDKLVAMLLIKAECAKRLVTAKGSVRFDNEVFDEILNVNLVSIKPFA